jgi:hypothetical protein
MSYNYLKLIKKKKKKSNFLDNFNIFENAYYSYYNYIICGPDPSIEALENDADGEDEDDDDGFSMKLTRGQKKQYKTQFSDDEEPLGESIIVFILS